MPEREIRLFAQPCRGEAAGRERSGGVLRLDDDPASRACGPGSSDQPLMDPAATLFTRRAPSSDGACRSSETTAPRSFQDWMRPGTFSDGVGRPKKKPWA